MIGLESGIDLLDYLAPGKVLFLEKSNHVRLALHLHGFGVRPLASSWGTTAALTVLDMLSLLHLSDLKRIGKDANWCPRTN